MIFNTYVIYMTSKCHGNEAVDDFDFETLGYGSRNRLMSGIRPVPERRNFQIFQNS